jgi:hypothetical protein
MTSPRAVHSSISGGRPIISWISCFSLPGTLLGAIFSGSDQDQHTGSLFVIFFAQVSDASEESLSDI